MKHYFYTKLRPIGILFFKNLRYLMLLILLPLMVIVGITIFSMSQFINNEMNVYALRSLNNYQAYTESLFSSYFMQTSFLGNDDDVQLFFLHDADSKPYYSYKNLEKLVKNTMAINEVINSVYLHSLSSDQVYTDRGLYQADSFYDPDALLHYDAYTTKVHSWFVHRESAEGTSLISYYQPIGTPSSPMGVIIINFDFQKFCRQMKSLKGEYDDALFILDSDSQHVGTLFGESLAFPSSVISGKLTYDGAHASNSHYIYHTASISYTNWYFLLSVPTSVSFYKLFDILQPILLILILTIVFILAATLYISLQLYSPIRSIMQMVMEAVPEYAELRTDRPEEEAFITTVVMNTINKNKHMSKEIDTHLKTLKKAQSIALQSQINPHFLYNTLDCINWTAMGLTHSQNEVSVMITKLASMLRYSLEDVNTLVPLEKELEHAQDYLELQAVRYMDRFRAEWEIQPEAYEYPTIKIVLQPLLENAIYHGIKPLPPTEKGLITVKTHYTEEAFLITVSDNGVGMNPEAVRELNLSFASEDIRQKAHIGLQNVNQRIKLILGDAYGLSVTSTSGEGTIVTCRLPLKTESSEM